MAAWLHIDILTCACLACTGQEMKLLLRWSVINVQNHHTSDLHSSPPRISVEDDQQRSASACASPQHLGLITFSNGVIFHALQVVRIVLQIATLGRDQVRKCN